jgi:peptidoglycan/xylan/chitin deacetylase (PgdA/CDA1 family)
MADSRAALRRAFGVEVDHFCYPYGSFAASTMELVRRAGYLSAVTVEPGIARATDDRFRLPRILVDGDSGWWKFVLQVATPFEQLRHRRRAG